MQFYKVWKKDEETSTNFLVAAVDSDQAKDLVVEHLEKKITAKDLRLGYATKFDSEWVTVWKSIVHAWGYSRKAQTNAWAEWESCKRSGKSKVIAEYRP